MADSQKKGLSKGVIIGLAILVVILGASSGYFYYQLISLNTMYQSYVSSHSHTDAEYNALNSSYISYQLSHTYTNTEYNTLLDKYNSLYSNYTCLQSNTVSKTAYNQLVTQYNTLLDKYKALKNLLEGAIVPPYIQIENRTAHIVFKASSGSLHEWTIGVDAFEAQVCVGWYKREISHDLEYLDLRDKETGEIHHVIDYRPFVVENNFATVIPNLYHELNNDDQAFVHEVWFIVTQLTTYSSEIEDTPRFPLETMIGGGGDCEDMAILIASMLKAAPANYVVKLVYMDAYNPTDPKDVNHVTVWVETPSGYKTFVDGTSHTEMCPFTEVEGWYLEV